MVEKWKYEKKMGKANYWTWAVDLWLTSYTEKRYKQAKRIAENNPLSYFMEYVRNMVLTGAIKDFGEDDIQPAIKHTDYESIYKSLKE